TEVLVDVLLGVVGDFHRHQDDVGLVVEPGQVLRRVVAGLVQPARVEEGQQRRLGRRELVAAGGGGDWRATPGAPRAAGGGGGVGGGRCCGSVCRGTARGPPPAPAGGACPAGPCAPPRGPRTRTGAGPCRRPCGTYVPPQPRHVAPAPYSTGQGCGAGRGRGF